MRIVYDNLIDDLTATNITALTEIATYPIRNVQDQRLTTRYHTDSTTSQSVTFTLPTFPEIPDYASGITYLADWSAGIDTWATSTSAITASGGTLIATATGTSFGAIKTIAAGASKTYRLKVVSSRGGPFTFYATGGAGEVAVFTTTLTALTPYLFDTFTTSTVTAIRTNITGGTAGDILQHYFCYIGTGQYSTQLTDNSGNGNHGTVYGATPVAGVSGKALAFDGVNDYVAGTPVLGSPDIYSTSFRVRQDGVNNTAADARCPINVGGNFGENGILVFANNGGSSYNITFFRLGENESVAACFTLVTGVWAHIVIVISCTAKTYVVYKDGVVSKSGTLTYTPLPPVNKVSIGSHLNVAFRYLGAIDGTKIYNRALSSGEVLNLSSGISFATESMGLVADWTLDKDLQVNTAAILGHNIKAGCTVKIQANNTNEWSYPAVSETFSYVTPDKMILKFLASTYTYKYWKFTFSGMGDIQIGRMWLGKYLQINPSSLDNFTVNKKRSDTVLYGRNRQKYASPGIGWREFNLSFPKSDTNMMYNLETMYDQVGNHSSFIFCNFDSLRDYQIVDPCYCSLDGGIDFNHIGQQNYNYSLKLSEDK